MGRKLRAGTARADITPPPGIAHANWGAQTHERAAGIDLPLWATALALGDGERTVVVLDLDLLSLRPADAREIRSTVAERAGLPESRVRLSCTHTHSGPTLNRETWAERGTELIEPYLDELRDQAAGIAWRAVESTETTWNCALSVTTMSTSTVLLSVVRLYSLVRVFIALV